MIDATGRALPELQRGNVPACHVTEPTNEKTLVGCWPGSIDHRCGIRRRVYPMRRGDEIYGALVTGEHRFYVTPKGKREFLVGRAYFTQLMLLKDGSWKIARIFSYEHVDAEPADRHRR